MPAGLKVSLQTNQSHSLISAFLRDCLIHAIVSAASKVFHFSLRELSAFDEKQERVWFEGGGLDQKVDMVVVDCGECNIAI
jgi:hypothetical protein